MMDGRRLYDLVRHYVALGHHRTGSEVDEVTADWMAEMLRELGLTVELEPIEFERWRGTSSLTIGGEQVDHLPVYYAWTGSIDTENVQVQSIDPLSGGFPAVVDEPIEWARAGDAAAVVLATEHPNGSLVAVNRDLDAPRPGFPAVLAAGRDLGRLQSGPLRLSLTARTEPGVTTNVVAHNQREGPPLVLTTPLNGWFGCAGERGTGIAVLLSLVERLSDRPLVVVATGGHELGWFGAHHWVTNTRLTAAAVIHIGASVAVEEETGDGRRELVPTRLAMTSLGPAAAEPVANALDRAGLWLQPDTTRWIGEGEAFHRVPAPLLSFTGAGIDFHTPEDTPSRVTSPEALEIVADAIGEAADLMERLGRQRLG